MPRTTKAELEAERLLWRAGFGPAPGEAKRLGRLGRRRAVEQLLAPKGRALGGRPARIDGGPLDPVNAYGHDVLWWLDRAARTRHPLAERMTLNWHDHFATSNEKVGDVKLMMRQYWLLRNYGLGSFRALTKRILRDGAMQMFLDLAGSEKGSPNENFARELFELFTLGVNNGYTERDIREAARALTGFTFDYDTKRFGFDPDRHDRGVKRVFGKRGRFTPEDIIDLAINHPKHAPYLCEKLWHYFTPLPVPPRTLKQMVSTYRRSGTEIRPVLRIILTHPSLYADLTSPHQVKPPVVYAAGMLRRTNTRIADESWIHLLDEMGQRPFHPPNVAGWDQDDAWLTPATISARFDAASMLVQKRVKDGSISASQSPQRAIAAARKATGDPQISKRTALAMQRYAVASVKGRTDDWEVKHYFPERQRVLRHVLLAGPDAQVC
ncbi:MAG: DUF1800 domain-containing protein [Thermoleophilia bacterium]|nr:DUF1800 domain-containing protein [Thermoleophilia bacterium]